MSINVSINMGIYLSIYPYICLSIYLYIYLSIYIYTSTPHLTTAHLTNNQRYDGKFQKYILQNKIIKKF